MQTKERNNESLYRESYYFCNLYRKGVALPQGGARTESIQKHPKMEVVAFFKGIVIGLVASIPLGPIGVLCIQRTLSKNHRSGFVSGLGAATADSLFAAVALFSLTVVMSLIESHIVIIKALGGISVIIVGMAIFLKNPVVQIRRNRAGKGSLWSDFLSLFFITLANPAFILIFVALFAAWGVSYSGIGLAEGMMMVLGVLVGAALWWFMLTFCVNLLRKRFRPRHLLWINRVTGAVIVILGAVAILSIFVQIQIQMPVNAVLPK